MPASTGRMDIEREIRLAVVMYGGVSLAIYINGVAQELLQLARATPTSPALQSSLGSTAVTYRRLAQLLSMSEPARKELEQRIQTDSSALERALAQHTAVKVRFVIDTISGTSAGGINGIFLGKALARNADLDDLTHMWIEEGDILKLINDKKSLEGLGPFPGPDDPKSLLNGQRMYRRLVEALDGMDPEPAPQQPVASGYVDDLDLFVTTTDVNSLPVYLRLADGIVTERRYRNVLHFRHRQDGSTVRADDFGKDNNPFLAFAARCTSSFPVAFEPMRLETIGEMLETVKGRRDEADLGTNQKRWKPFFPDYRPTASVRKGEYNPHWYDFWRRPFCDGGYLDNKPFSHAIDALSKRVSRLPCERKLIYIEPDPEHPQTQRELRTPNALENAVLASTISGYETIREDLERVLERNRVVERVERILSGSDNDLARWRKRNAFASDTEFLEGDLDAMIDHYGPAYGGYHRLKVGHLTDEIGDWIGAALDFDAGSAHVAGIRLLVRAWREMRYGRSRGEPLPDDKSRRKKADNLFLYEFDPLYRIRRLRFVLARIDRLRALRALGDSTREAFEKALEQAGVAAPAADEWSLDEIEQVLDKLRTGLRPQLEAVVRARECLLCSGENNPLHEKIKSAAIGSKTLETVVRGRTFRERFKAAQNEMQQPELIAEVDAVSETLRTYVQGVREKTSKGCKDAFARSTQNTAGWPRSVVELVKSYYDHYLGYDFVSFPVLYATSVGEELATTEVIRISPEDAKSLVGFNRHDRRHKLAGTALMHFGAFLERSWRKNDMLWGRLDAADRLITSLLPQDCPNLTAALVRDAQVRILDEHYRPMGAQVVLGFLSQIVGQYSPSSTTTRKLGQYVGKKARSAPPALDRAARAQLAAAVGDCPLKESLVEEALRHNLGAEKLLEFFRSPEGYEVDRHPTATTSALALARSATVLGKVLDGIGAEHRNGSLKKIATWLTRVARVFWGLVEVATPRSLPELLGRHAFRVLYVVEIFLIIVGAALGHNDAMKLGWMSLALTLALRALWWLIHDWLTGSGRAPYALKALAAACLCGFAAYGVYSALTKYPAGRNLICSAAGFDCTAKSTNR